MDMTYEELAMAVAAAKEAVIVLDKTGTRLCSTRAMIGGERYLFVMAKGKCATFLAAVLEDMDREAAAEIAAKPEARS